MGVWRKIANILLWLSIITLSLGVLIGSARLFRFNIGIGFAVLLGGAIVILVSHTLFGMFIELCNNIAAIRNNDGIPPLETANVSALSEKRNWNCTGCGTDNEDDAKFCITCGKKKG